VSGKELGVVTPLGIVFLALTMLSSAFYKTVNRIASAQFTTFERTFLVLTISAIAFGISGMSTVKWDVQAFVAPFLNWEYALSVLSLSVLSSIAANMLVNYALAHMSLFKVSAFGALSTLCTAIAGIAFLKEPFNVSLVLGGGLILVGVYLLTTKGAKK